MYKNFKYLLITKVVLFAIVSLHASDSDENFENTDITLLQESNITLLSESNCYLSFDENIHGMQYHPRLSKEERYIATKIKATDIQKINYPKGIKQFQKHNLKYTINFLINGTTKPQNNYTIIFNGDAKQPTTEDAAKLSCANIDDENITQWYVDMFCKYKNGMKIINNSKLQYANILEEHDVNKTISLNGKLTIKSKDVKQKNTISPSKILIINSQQDVKIMNCFRAIASNPVGRVLLYRLLIEITRHNSENQYVEEFRCLPEKKEGLLKNRQSILSINIEFNSKAATSTFNTTGYITLNNTKFSKMILTIKDQILTLTDDEQKNDELDIDLFHEMLHWYHKLRNGQRFNNSSTGNAQTYYQYHVMIHPYFYLFSTLNICNPKYDEKEVRTIIGMPNCKTNVLHKMLLNERILALKLVGENININNLRYQYLEGDDLSENAYRASKKFYMRVSLSPSTLKIDVKNNLLDFSPIILIFMHTIAYDCYSDIVKISNKKQNYWRFLQKEAIKFD